MRGYINLGVAVAVVDCARSSSRRRKRDVPGTMQPCSRFLLCAAAALLCIGGSKSLKLPSYIPACARNDPELNACMKKNAEIALPGIVKGDRKYRVPPLEPFFISRMVLEQEGQGGGPGFSLVLSDASLSGLSKASIEDIRADLDKYILELELFFPHLELQTKYKLSGRFQSFPINGEGPGNITMTNVKVNCKFDFKQEKRKDGLTYLTPNTPTLTFDIGGRLHLKLDNLINGDKSLGENMNAVLNDNWRDVAKTLGPGVSDLLGALLQQTISGMFELVPVEEIFV